MPIKSNFPDVNLSVTDIFSLLFDRKEKPFPDDQGTLICSATVPYQITLVSLSHCY